MFFLGRFVKTTANATVDHLSKYLALRVALEKRRTNAEEGGDGAAGGGEGSSLSSVSEKQYTIYILTRGGQFSVSTHTHTHTLHSMPPDVLLASSTQLGAHAEYSRMIL